MKRIFLGLFCLLSIALFVHFREVKIESFELDSTADHYVVSPVDFSFPDDEATQIIRSDILKEIGKVYEVDDEDLKQNRFDFDNYLINRGDWQQFVRSSYEELYHTGNNFLDFLEKVRFVDIKTFQKLKKIGFDEIKLVVFIPRQKGEELFSLSSNYWDTIKELFLKSIAKPNKPVVDFVVNFLTKKDWTLTTDSSIEGKLKRFVKEKVPQKYTQISAGTKIIAQGDKITARHMAILEAMKKEIKKERSFWDAEKILGSLLLAFVFVFISALYFKIDQPQLLNSLQKESIVVAVVVTTLLLAKLCEIALLSSFGGYLRYPILVPFAAILLTILLGGRIALYCSAFLSILIAMTLNLDMAPFLVINLVTALIAILYTKALRKRTEVFIVCFKCWLGAVAVILAFNAIFHTFWNVSQIIEIILALAFLFFTAILAIGFLPLLEHAFNVMTDITLMEYMDPRLPLLQRLMNEMPGTYQHSLFLGNLAESVASSIGANALFCKVASVYHDIGKLVNPEYFSENQKEGDSSHKNLLPLESAKIIISHVSEGEKLAEKGHLPISFIDIIKEHHGTTLAYYFYHEEMERQKGTTVDEASFRYPGPKPHSKESAIIMICDAVEAAARSLGDVSEEKLVEMIDKVIEDRSADGQFDAAPLTFEEIEKIKKVLVKTLLASHHIRIKYPDKNFR